MSATTEAIEIIEELVEAKIPKSTAKKLIDYADKKRGDIATKQDIENVKQDVENVKQNIENVKQSISMLKWAVGLLALVMIGGFALFYDMLSDTKEEIKGNRELLIQILQKK